MKFKPQKEWKKFFAVMPNECDNCHCVFWLEHGYWRVAEFGTLIRCSDCPSFLVQRDSQGQLRLVNQMTGEPR